MKVYIAVCHWNLSDSGIDFEILGVYNKIDDAKNQILTTYRTDMNDLDWNDSKDIEVIKNDTSISVRDIFSGDWIDYMIETKDVK